MNERHERVVHIVKFVIREIIRELGDLDQDLWCPVDIRDYEQRSRDRASVCACVLEREFEV